MSAQVSMRGAPAARPDPCILCLDGPHRRARRRRNGENGPVTDSTTTSDASAFADPRRYVAIPRISELALSPAGDRLVATVSALDGDGARLVRSLWELDGRGDAPARRLTRSEKGESSPVFCADGSLLFLSRRPRPGGKEDDPAAIWRILPDGGEPWPVASRSGEITSVAAAHDAPVVVFAAKVAPGAGGAEDRDETWHGDRKTREVTAVLHEGLPIRHWDHERGPEEVHYFVGTLPTGQGDGVPLAGVRDLTPDAGRALHDASPAVSADGSTVVTAWEVGLPAGRVRVDIVRIDVATGARTVLASSPTGEWSYDSPVISRDGRRVACFGESRATLEEPWARELFVVDLAGGAPRRVPIDGDLWPAEARWAADGAALLVTGDLSGHHPVWRVDHVSGASVPVTADGAWSHVHSAPDGALFALRSRVDSPARPVCLDPPARGNAGPERVPREIPAPGGVAVPGRVEELRGAAADGAALRAWLVLPEGASAEHPAPLALWVHGGPCSSWNSWSWRWNPWLLAARGGAVLLPDPALSTGYGMDFVRRGWAEWGGRPFSDLMTMTDLALERADLDPGRTAAMGGSYGGYMANWIAGHTDRFSAIVSHASIWSTAQFRATTDYPFSWTDGWGRPEDRPDFYRTWSPDTYVDAISTPMLVVHGKNDYRCPVSESLRLWTDLVERGVDAKFLSFPDENHWIVKPGDATAWYETVLAFLDHHVLGAAWVRPSAL